MVIGGGVNAKYTTRSVTSGKVCHIELCSSKVVDTLLYTWHPEESGATVEQITNVTAANKSMGDAKVVFEITASRQYDKSWPQVEVKSQGKTAQCNITISGIPERYINRPISIFYMDDGNAKILEVTGFFNSKGKFEFYVHQVKRKNTVFHTV